MQVTLEVVLSALAVLVAVGATGLVWRFREAKGAMALVAFNAAVVVWTGGNALQAAATSLGWKLLWVNVQYVGVVVLPVAGFAFGARFAGYDRLTSRRVLAAAAIPFAVLLALSLTNEVLGHGLVRATASVESEAGVFADDIVVLQRTWGPVFWAGWLYSQFVNLTATALIASAVLYAQDLYRRQAAALVLGALVPWIGHVLFLGGIVPVEPEVFFSVTGAAFVYAVTRHRFLELQPLARDLVLESLEDGVIVLDERDVVIDVNAAAAKVFGEAVLGASAADAFGDHPDLLDAYREGTSAETTIEIGGTALRYDVRVLSSTTRSGLRGTIIVLHDVTALAERERELERKNRHLEEFASLVSHDLRGPLSVATGYVAMERDEQDSEQLAKSAAALDRMDAIIDDLLALAFQNEPVEETEPVPLPEAAWAAWGHVETGDVDLVVETDRAVEVVRGRLLSALENLFANARKHGDASVVRIQEVAGGFAVADDGVGIDDPGEALEWGYTTDQDGTGYGLAIVRRVADAHGWELSLDASESGGAMVAFTGVDWAPASD